MNIPYLSFLRPAAINPQTADVQFAADHAAAAAAAFSLGRPVLLTTGTKHLTPYVAASRRTGLRLVVRRWTGRRRSMPAAGQALRRNASFPAAGLSLWKRTAARSATLTSAPW